MSEIPIFYIDLFSGAGGTTTGIHMVDTGVKVVACVNHDKNAIQSHKANHPDCLHFTEDVRDWNVVVALQTLVSKLRKEHPSCVIALWASLECTNYSKAKGGLPRDADSRTLAHALFMYIELLQPDYIDIENVREFMAWGPLDENGKPVSSKNGRDYIRWVKKMKSYGYNYDFQLLDAADFGAFTSRLRYFGQFAKIGMPISWPEPTHSKKPVHNGLFEGLKGWNAVREVLDLEDKGKSIFTRKTPLCENTLKRILAGLIKFVANGDDTFLAAYYSTGQNVHSLDNPCPTISTKDRFMKVHPISFMDQQYGKSLPQSISQPSGAITANPKFNLVTSHYLLNPSWGGHCYSIDKPSPVIVARQDKAPVSIVRAESHSYFAIPYFDQEHETMKKIRLFMAIHGIIDITMRMLKIPELLLIQGFPSDYILKGTQTEQKKYIGNAVVPLVPKALVISRVNALSVIKKQAV